MNDDVDFDKDHDDNDIHKDEDIDADDDSNNDRADNDDTRIVMKTSISLIRTVSIMVYMMMIWDDKHHDDDYENVTEVTQS